MASGLASIATSVGGATDLIEDGKNGILIPPDDPQALLAALLTMLSDSDRRMQFGVNGRSFIEKNYSLSAVADKLNALYRNFASKPKWR
jgi:glycosyltransferase involved in cell wall biosynthesis